MGSLDAEFDSSSASWDPGAAVDARLEAMLGTASGPVNWRVVGPADAADRWKALRQWVIWFRAEFGYDHRVVPPCWYRHPALVNLLSALRDHWQYAYDPTNTAVAASDWHRALMVIEQRLREWAARTGCTVGVHRPDVLADYPDDTDAWQQHVAADVTARASLERARQTAHTRSGDERDGGVKLSDC
ncbi:MAG: hypothetical protein J2P16_11035 [Mycobacterium sp.]|nr:hypothetical protein [Mycobacterium sp.]